MSRCGLAMVAVWCLTASASLAQETGGDLRAATQNPISSLVSLPFKFTFDNGADNGDANILNIQPVYPVTAGDWNLVNRVIAPIADAPGGVPNLPSNPGIGEDTGDRAFGLGDINYSLFLNPTETTTPFIWGAGGSITLPTATSSELGSGKWSAGPTAVVLFQPGWGTYGLLGRHLWSVAGPNGREDVNSSLIEPFINYNLDDGWYLISDSVITANWTLDSGDRWTLPLGGGAGKLFQIGNQPMNMRAEAYYNVLRPDAGPEWTIGFTIQFLFPK
ncbi:MAG: neuromedin U [Geminicoccaceae bacterium]